MTGKIESQSGKLNSPHDKLFRQLFSNKEKAADFLRGTLPEKILAKLDLNSLKRDPDSFVDDELKEHFADVVYQCKFGEEYQVEIALLFEHKTKQPPFPHLQLLRYMLKLWETRVGNGKLLQPVLPILFYHGKKAWEERSFESYFGKGGIPEELRAYVPQFDFKLVDLRVNSDETIRNQFHIPALRTTLLLMKYINSPNLREKLPFIMLELLKILKEEGMSTDLNPIFVYLHSTISKQIRVKAMKDILYQLEHEDEEEEQYEFGVVVGSEAWQDIKESYEKGLAEGQDLAAQKLLRKGFSVAETAQILDFDPSRVQALKDKG